MSLTEQDHDRLNRLVQTVLETWSQRHREPPDVLYHYTSADGLIGILSSKSIWLTDLRHMNDLSELQYSRELVQKRFAARLELPGLSDIQKKFIGRISSSFDPFRSRHAVFSASFCEEGNLLSQWRAYRGRGGGYALGFDFFHLLRLLSRPCVLRRVLYHENEQISVVDYVIGEFLDVLESEAKLRGAEEVTESFLPYLCQAFSDTIGELMFCFKHPDFREEREWRLVHFASVSPTSSRSKDLPRFRSYDGNIIPYVSVEFEKAITLSVDDTYGYGFPLAEVMIGPTINADLNQESVKLLLLSLNPDIIPNINRSGIPLRWL